MGKHIIAKTGNIAAVQKQLGASAGRLCHAVCADDDGGLAQVLDDR